MCHESAIDYQAFGTMDSDVTIAIHYVRFIFIQPLALGENSSNHAIFTLYTIMLP